MAKDKEPETTQPELQPQDPPEPEEEEAPTRRLDPEVQTLNQVIRTLDKLEPEARVRIVAFISSRYKGA